MNVNDTYVKEFGYFIPNAEISGGVFYKQDEECSVEINVVTKIIDGLPEIEYSRKIKKSESDFGWAIKNLEKAVKKDWEESRK